jgi:S-DNA-T family DNA segregation ATPase FtsK/SpoIIIE
MGSLAACDDVVIWAIDLKNGMELSPWAPCIDRLATSAGQAAVLLADAVAVLQARAGHLAATGQRVWEPFPDMPALVIIVDEYAELADEAPASMSDTDSVARLGRAVAVTLVAATQRPTQKAMGQGAVRSQMDIRICFRVRERKDVDLILGTGMLNAGWHAHTLNAPGKFLVSSPEHTTPKRARAYLVTDDDVVRTDDRYGFDRPQLDTISLGALHRSPAPAEPVPWYLARAQRDAGEPDGTPDEYEPITQEGALWGALCGAPDDGADVAELLQASGMTRPTLYRHLGALADAGRAIQVSRGRWRAARDGDGGRQ